MASPQHGADGVESNGRSAPGERTPRKTPPKKADGGCRQEGHRGRPRRPREQLVGGDELERHVLREDAVLARGAA